MSRTLEYSDILKEHLLGAYELDNYSLDTKEVKAYQLGISEFIYLGIDWYTDDFIKSLIILRDYGIRGYTFELQNNELEPVDRYTEENDFTPIVIFEVGL